MVISQIIVTISTTQSLTTDANIIWFEGYAGMGNGLVGLKADATYTLKLSPNTALSAGISGFASTHSDLDSTVNAFIGISTTIGK